MTPNRSIPDLLNDLVGQMSALFRNEVQLVRAEASEKVHQATNAVVYLAVGGVLLFAALLALLGAIVAWLVILGIEVQWSTLIVAAVVALIGYILLRKGMNDMKARNLTPNRTVAQIQNDARTAREQFR